ncbi:hypothetical protein TCDM_12093 [Trypanosoma cruzi Dm28c]|uniref:Uncharacterized protein n=1 Tax=Trypanosoma cruzi Dm28c TaxID=1416333 RepID=V5B7N2_TRYCR|nr:hypothetical protein TCDM_12093 [Trypanosoma cruzi Dm28c]
MAAAFSAVQYHEPEQSLYFRHAPLLYSFFCAFLYMLCSLFLLLCFVCLQAHTNTCTKCRLQWILMLLLWRLLAVVGGCCCFLRGHEGKEGGSAHRESLSLRV